jgi:hypothetical protein
VAALDLYSQYDEDIAERDRRQRLILAWQQEKPTGRLQASTDQISLRCELDTRYCGIMRRCSGSGMCLGEGDPGGIIPRHPDAAR